MQVEIGTDLQRLIDEAIRFSGFSSAAQVIEAGVRLFRDRYQEASHVTPSPSADPAQAPAGPHVAQPAGMLSIPAQSQLLLFPDALLPSPLQPWRLAKQQSLNADQVTQREVILAAIGRSELAGMEQKVAFILHRYPETRDDLTAAVVRYWSEFQGDVLERWDGLTLDVLHDLDRFDTIDRIRRHLQNDLRLFAAAELVQRGRDVKQQEFHQYLVSHSLVQPEIRFYLDETGNEANKPYIGVAGLCVMEWKQYAKHHAALSRWRERQGWPATLHFPETGSEAQPRALSLLSQLQARRSGLLFVGYALRSRGMLHQNLVSLFVQIVSDSLSHMGRLGCLNGTRQLRIIKEADVGFDALYLDPMKQCMAEQLGKLFPGQIHVVDIEALPKGREVMLECADFVAGGMQRRALFKGTNPKDVLAEAIFNVTGFEDPRDNGIVFKAHLS